MPVVNPGIRRLLASAIQRLFNGASFSAPLTHSLVPERGTGSATFTRATTATVRDHEGVLRTAIAGEARFEGARRVRNILAVTNTENMLGGGFSYSATVNSATSVSYLALGNQLYGNVGSATPAIGTTFCVQVMLSGVAGNKINLYMMNGAATSGAGVQITLTETPTVYSVTGTVSNSSQHYLWLMPASYLSIPAGTAIQTITATKWQAEDITGRADQTTPSEYVSVGVESAPYYHGSFVDGVKCFPTDISGNPIPSTTLLGYQAEGARTNLCLQSNAFTTTWTDGGAAAAQDATGPDGATSAWTLTDDSAVSAESRYQAITLTAADHVLSIFVGKTVGAQSSYPVLMLTHTGDAFRAIATIDTTNGVITPWTAVDGSTIVTSNGRCVSYNDDLWRAELTFTGTAAAWNLYIAPAATANASQSTGTFDATVTGSAVFYGAQVELGSFASSYIPTTTAAVTRNADVLTYSSAGNIDGTKGWCYAEVSTSTVDGEQISIVDAFQAGAGLIPLMVDAANNFILLDPSVTVRTFTASVPRPITSPDKLVSTWASGASRGAIDGVLGATAGYTTGAAAPLIGVGIRADSGAVPLFGNIGPIYIGQRQLSASELQAITS